MRTVLAYPGNMAHAQQAALALDEAGCLDCFVTSLDWRRESRLGRLASRLPGGAAERALRAAARKAIVSVPPDRVRTYAAGEIARLAAARVGGPILKDKVWDWASRRFDRHVARRYAPGAEALQAFEYTALHAFERAAERGIARILHMPSLDSLEFETLRRAERADWPELRSADDAYFDAKFEARYARRRAEIALADVVVANSSLTARSHIAAGADPAKLRVAPLAAPTPIARLGDIDTRRPLTLIWAGPFSLRKGAHYLLEAWRRLAAGGDARLDVYGEAELPARVLAAAAPTIRFLGARPQRDLFAAYTQADALVFPTLSDGFGMVVAEALAHGLPVISTDRAGAADLLDAENGLVVPSRDPDALAGAIRWCLDHRERLAEMRPAALAAARARQWPDFRRDLIAAIGDGLAGAGYSPRYQWRRRDAG